MTALKAIISFCFRANRTIAASEEATAKNQTPFIVEKFSPPVRSGSCSIKSQWKKRKIIKVLRRYKDREHFVSMATQLHPAGSLLKGGGERSDEASSGEVAQTISQAEDP